MGDDDAVVVDKTTAQHWAANANFLMQLVTVLAVIGGVLLIVWELEETRQMVRAQLASEQVNHLAANRRLIVGENPAIAWKKGCLNPEELTDEETIAYVYLLDLHFLAALRVGWIEDIGKFGTPVESVSGFPLSTYLSHPLGRWDYDKNGHDRSLWPEFMSNAASRLIANDGLASCDEWLSPRLEFLQGKQKP